MVSFFWVRFFFFGICMDHGFSFQGRPKFKNKQPHLAGKDFAFTSTPFCDHCEPTSLFKVVCCSQFHCLPRSSWWRSGVWRQGSCKLAEVRSNAQTFGKVVHEIIHFNPNFNSDWNVCSFFNSDRLNHCTGIVFAGWFRFPSWRNTVCSGTW